MKNLSTAFTAQAKYTEYLQTGRKIYVGIRALAPIIAEMTSVLLFQPKQKSKEKDLLLLEPVILDTTGISGKDVMALPWVMPAEHHWHSLQATVLRVCHVPKLWIGPCLQKSNSPCGKQRAKIRSLAVYQGYQGHFMAIHRV